MEPVTRAQAGFQVLGKRDIRVAMLAGPGTAPDPAVGLRAISSTPAGRRPWAGVCPDLAGPAGDPANVRSRPSPGFRDGITGRARKRLGTALVGLCALLDLACGGTPSVAELDDGLTGSPTRASEVAEADTEATEAGAEVVADTVVIGLRRLPASLDPTAELDPWGQRVVDDLLFEGLTRRLPDAPWAEPALADSCQVEQEGRVVACRVRPGARFHDDQPVTVADVLYSINLWLGSRGANLRQRYGLDDLKSVEEGGPPGASGSGWVRITFAGHDPLVLERLAAMKIVPRAKHAGPGKFSQKPIGTGPMEMVSQTEDSLIFARREAIPGRARQIELRARPDGAMALTALRRGEIHLLPELAPIHVPRELGKPGMAARFDAFLLSPPRYDIILYNLREGPQAGPRMRSALDQSLPRVEIATTVQGVAGLPVLAPVDLTVPSPIDLVAIADARIADAGLGPLAEAPDTAADATGRATADLILTDLGWLDSHGQRRRGTAPLRMPVSWDGSPGLATGVVRAMRASWKQIGISTPSVTAGWSYILSLLRSGTFHVALARLAGSSDMDLSPWFHSRGAHNLSGIADGELDGALTAYRQADSRAARDAAKRAIAARLAVLHPVSVLHAPLQVLLASRGLTGLEFIDDLPRLDSLGLGTLPGPGGLAGPVPLHGDGG